MRPHDLDLESQGQGHAKVMLAKNFQKSLRTMNDCDHAECEGVVIRLHINFFRNNRSHVYNLCQWRMPLTVLIEVNTGYPLV